MTAGKFFLNPQWSKEKSGSEQMGNDRPWWNAQSKFYPDPAQAVPLPQHHVALEYLKFYF